jgi:hypothetical protein
VAGGEVLFEVDAETLLHRPVTADPAASMAQGRACRGWVRTMGVAPEERISQRALLLSRLTVQRQHVLAQLEGLTDEQLRRPVLPSGWSCLALVRHLTLSDERYWFEVVMAGEALVDTSVHAGHLDAVRELLDGHQHIVL